MKTQKKKQRLKVAEYARKMQCNTSTVYRQIQQGKLESEEIDGVLHVVTGAVQTSLADENEEIELLKEQIEQLKSENEYLRMRLDNATEERQQANETIADMQQRHDTIVMSLSNQVDRQQKMLEDLRERSLWVRVRTALGFASA